MDEEKCPVCGKDLTPADVDSLTVSEWDSVSQSNSLVQMFCSINHLIEWVAMKARQN